jgi:DNA-binding transcriptional MocR family regulator
MKVGDVIRFKATDVIGTIVSVWPRSLDWTEVKVLHNAPNIQNPTGFSLSHLIEHAEIISIS